MFFVDNKEIYINPNFPGLVYASTLTGNVLTCSNQFAQFLGKTEISLITSHSLQHYFTKDTLFSINQNNEMVIQNKYSRRFTETWQTLNALSIKCVCIRKPIYDKQKNCFAILVNAIEIDITPQKKYPPHETVKVRKKDKSLIDRHNDLSKNTNFAMSNFIANISHDLRTPLHTMLGIAELLQIKTHYPEQESLIEGIIESGKNLLQLVEQVLQYSEAEITQPGRIKIESFDLRQLIEKIIIEHTHQVKNNNVELIISYCETTPRHIKSNPQHLRRIISNLLCNAIKFTERGHVLVAVEPVSTNNTDVQLRIVIEDTGVGIDKKNLTHVFDRFYRALPSYISKYKGFGLGLAIAKQLTEHLGGNNQCKESTKCWHHL